ncbi:MAG: HAD family hydrolase [Christensenellales bacterium]|jgi:phosphoglycolate phosphatase-like HAD superfamily hydrolase
MLIRKINDNNIKVKAIVLDFDGTISTLRYGWEDVMQDMMTDYLGKQYSREISKYIENSAGIQTIFQMKWLKDKIESLFGDSKDAWYYKDDYNRRLMIDVNRKIELIKNNKANKEDYLIAGSYEFLIEAKKLDLKLHIASGTDQKDVKNEADLLGIAPLVDSISGAPYRLENCSKEKVLQDLIERQGLHGPEVCVIGDGKVEISLGNKMQARTLGLATDEAKRQGINPVKQRRLELADAEAITGDFLNINEIFSWLNLRG